MEIFVSCVGDLPTLEESELVVTPACFFPFLFFLFFLFVFLFVCPRGVGEWKALFWQLPCAVTELSF